MSEVMTKKAPKQERAHKTDAALAESLVRLMDAGIPFDDITVTDIVAGADCTTGAFYARYANKGSLLMHLYIEQTTPERYEVLMDVLSAESCRGKSLYEVIVDYFTAYAEITCKHKVAVKYVLKAARYEKTSVPEAALGRSRASSFASYDSLVTRVLERNSEVRHPDIPAAIKLCDKVLGDAIREHIVFSADVGQTLNQHTREYIHALAGMFLVYLQAPTTNQLHIPFISFGDKPRAEERSAMETQGPGDWANAVGKELSPRSGGGEEGNNGT